MQLPVRDLSNVFQTPQAPPRASASDLSFDAALIREQTLLVSALDSLPLPILILNHGRQIVFTNTAARALVGVDAIGQRPGEALNCLHAHLGRDHCGTGPACVACGAAEALTRYERSAEATHGECQIMQANARESLDLRVTVKPLRIESRHFVMMTLTDVSHQNRRLALERIFFHDLLNLAGTVSGYAEILQEMPPAGSSRGNAAYTVAPEFEYLRSLRRVAHTLSDEIRMHRDLLSAEDKRLTVQHAPIATDRLLLDLLDAYRCHPAARERSIRIAAENDPVDFTSDATLVRRVLGNMIKNALEAAVPRETIDVWATHTPDMISFHVRNAAVIDFIAQPHIYKRSFTTKGPGRGLGTYSIKLFTEQYLGGTAGFISFAETGTIFTIRLPRSPAQ